MLSDWPSLHRLNPLKHRHDERIDETLGGTLPCLSVVRLMAHVEDAMRVLKHGNASLYVLSAEAATHLSANVIPFGMGHGLPFRSGAPSN